MKLILSPVGTSIIGRLGEFLTRPILIARKSNLGPFPGGVGRGDTLRRKEGHPLWTIDLLHKRSQWYDSLPVPGLPGFSVLVLSYP